MRIKSSKFRSIHKIKRGQLSPLFFGRILVMYELKDLLPKKHELVIEITEKECFIFNYQDATLAELIDISIYFEKKKDLSKWLFGFLCEKQSGKNKIESKHFEKLNKAYILKLVDRVLETYACGFFAKAEPGEKENPPKHPISSLICLILEYSNETIDSLLNRTWKQIQFILGGIIWNLNEKTKKGQKSNQHKMRVWLGKQAMGDDVAKKMVADLEKKLPDIKFSSDKKIKL